MSTRSQRGGILVVGLVACALAGCGDNPPEIPPELLAPVSSGNGDYPAGPYGSEVGTVVENLMFAQHWVDASAANYDPAALTPVSFADYYNPDGSKDTELILLNTAAIWCTACKTEHQGSGQTKSLNQHHDDLRPKGLVILSLLFQDAASNPATVNHLVAWTEGYETRHPMGLDPEYQMGRFGSAANAPLNIVVDARNMTILKRYIGDQAAVIWPYIEGELAARQSR